MIESVAEMNKMGDEEVSKLVDEVLKTLREADAMADAVHPPIIAHFVTAHLLLRIHNLVSAARGRSETGGWSKQAAMARVVAVATGVQLRQEDAEYIGNSQDTFLRNYTIALKKAKQSMWQAASKAKKKGKEPSTCFMERIEALHEQVFRCSFGGVPRNVIIPQGQSSLPIHRQPVPVRRIEHADETNLQLKQEVAELKERERSAQREWDREHERQVSLTGRELRARIQVEEHLRQEGEARRVAEEKFQNTFKEFTEHKRTVASEADRTQGQIARLGCQVAAAHVEAARAVEREERARKEAERILEEEAATRRAAEETVKEMSRLLTEEKRMVASEVDRTQGQIARLGCQVAAAHVEAARAVEREERARKEAERILEEVAATRRAAEETVKETTRRLKEEKHAVQVEVDRANAQLARLGAQVTAAHVEAARAVEREERACKDKEKLDTLLARKEEEKQNALKLKNGMAQRKRDAEARAGTADVLAEQLKESRKRCREFRAEVQTLRASMSSSYAESDASSEEDSGDEEENSEAEQDKEKEEAAAALRRFTAMPTWRPVRGKGAGKGAAKMDWGVRLVIYALHALMVPPSAIGMVIVLIVKHTASWLNPAAPTCETVQRCRFELRFVEEALAARRVASAYRVRSIGFDETTKLGNSSLTSNVQIEPHEGAKLQDVILRAAYCPMGGTSELVVNSIETRCFSRLRDLLRRWREKFDEMYPDEEWTGPDPSLCSLHRLGGGGALISDTCNGARLSKELLAQLIAKQVRERIGSEALSESERQLIAKQVQERIGSEAWEAMSESEQKAAVATHKVDCWQHLRNIFLAEMSRAQAAHVAEELKPEIETFAAWERMSTDFSQVLRAAFKEFHHSCRYYKGHGRSFSVWLLETHPTAFALHLERADGGRQDLDYDAAIPLYVDRKYFVEYLHDHVFAKGHKNILEDFLYVIFRSQQYVAMVRANAIVDILISRPMRWLSGKSSKLTDWSPSSMGTALDIVEQFLLKAQHDGSLFLDPNLDLFKEIADKQPLFAEWRRFCEEEDHVLSADGSTRHLIWKQARQELLHPSDATNISTRMKVIEYLEVQSRAALRKIHDPKLALRDKLSSLNGENCVGNSSEAHAATIGCHSTNDQLAEGVFGTFDMILRRFQGISMEAASAVSQAIRSQMLSLGDHVARRKASTKVEKEDFMGYIYSLPPHEQEALVECARITVKELRDQDRGEHAALDQYHKLRRKQNEADALDALFTRYALALSFFERWVKRGVEKEAEINAALNAFGPEGTREQDKLDWLREQVEMRVIGLSWTDWATPWSSSKDDYVGTVGQLKAHLVKVLAEEAALRGRGELPSKEKAGMGVKELAEECPAPQFRRKTFKSLGTPTAQATELCNDQLDMSPQEVLDAAQKRREQLERDSQIDWVSDRQPYSTGQGPLPGKNLIGKKLEVRWRYRHLTTREPVYIWCEGEVVQVADGEKDKASNRCKKLLPAGAVQIRWAADLEYDEQETLVWSILKPSSFNKDVHLGWRFSGEEVQKMEKEKEEVKRKKGASKSTARPARKQQKA